MASDQAAGDVEFVKISGSELTLRLTGNFWHNRQMVFDDVAKFIKDALPAGEENKDLPSPKLIAHAGTAGIVEDVVIEDPQQLQGFAETSNVSRAAFKDRERLTEEDLRKREAKGKNIYGENLEGPAAQFKRKKAENQAKYEEEVKKQRELDQQGDAAQIKAKTAIIEEKGLTDFFGGKGGQVGVSIEGEPRLILLFRESTLRKLERPKTSYRRCWTERCEDFAIPVSTLCSGSIQKDWDVCQCMSGNKLVEVSRHRTRIQGRNILNYDKMNTIMKQNSNRNDCGSEASILMTTRNGNLQL
eukprot:754086-Hanusia_phi.AAC.5